jgi:hypothetical protein
MSPHLLLGRSRLRQRSSDLRSVPSELNTERTLKLSQESRVRDYTRHGSKAVVSLYSKRGKGKSGERKRGGRTREVGMSTH